MTHRLIQQAQEVGTPLIDGDKVTFIWQGKWTPYLTGDFTDWDEQSAVRLTRIAPYTWQTVLSFPQDAYLEYKFLVNGELYNDPLNLRRTPNGLGKYNNYFYMPGSGPSAYLKRRRGFDHGSLTAYQVQSDEYLTGKSRLVYLYQPPVPEACPLLVVLDGVDYLRRAYLVNQVDNLIALKRILPVALAMIQNGRRNRIFEYTCSEATLGFLIDEILPFAASRLNLIDPSTYPGAYGILGASLGGLMALFTGLRLPQLFGKVLTQSGAFDYFSQNPLVFDLVRSAGRYPLKIWMDAGRFESLVESNRKMHSLLTSKGYPLSYREYNGGHCFAAWGNELSYGLEALFGTVDAETPTA